MASGFETSIVASVHLVGLRWSLVSYRREEPVVTRVAILGCGSVARGHVTGWREAGADVVLAVDADEPRARAFAHEVEIEETAGAWRGAAWQRHPPCRPLPVVRWRGVPAGSARHQQGDRPASRHGCGGHGAVGL